MLGKIRKISPIFHKIEGLWGGRVLSIALFADHHDCACVLIVYFLRTPSEPSPCRHGLCVFITVVPIIKRRIVTLLKIRSVASGPNYCCKCIRVHDIIA